MKSVVQIARSATRNRWYRWIQGASSWLIWLCLLGALIWAAIFN
ncbi:hypothetical protein [Pelagimonas sp. KU-00592-HH]